MKLIKIRSVNISEKKGTVKKPVTTIQLNETGITGDAHAGKWNRQVSLLGSESIEKFERENNRKINPGEFAENITTSGIKLYETHSLDRFVCEDLVLEVTQIGKKCHGTSCSIFKETGNCVMPKEGIFCRVVKPGKLTTSDTLQYIPHIFKTLILTISDRASAGLYEDLSGKAVLTIMDEFFKQRNLISQIDNQIISDDPEKIKISVSDAVENSYDLIITTGGTGIGLRDFTPDVIKLLIEKEIPGIMEYIRLKYGTDNPRALLSRSIAGIRQKTIIYALPGSKNAVKEYLSEITKSLMHTIYMLHGLDMHETI